MEIAHYLEEWNLTDPRPLAVTATSNLFTVTWNSRPAVLKLLTPIGIKDERGSAVALKCFNGHSSVSLYRHDEKAQLLEYAEGVNLMSLVEGGDDEEATAVISNVLNALHKAYTGPPPSGLTALKDRFRSLFRRASADGSEAPASIYKEAARLAEALLSTQTDVSVLHGDMHHENIVFSSRRGWLAIDPKGLYGDRTFDAANVLCNPVGRADLVTNEARLLRNAELLALNLRLSLDRLLGFTFAFACLSAAWSSEEQQNPELALNVARILERHVL